MFLKTCGGGGSIFFCEEKKDLENGLLLPISNLANICAKMVPTIPN